jgi:hypothetical protein
MIDEQIAQAIARAEQALCELGALCDYSIQITYQPPADDYRMWFSVEIHNAERVQRGEGHGLQAAFNVALEG